MERRHMLARAKKLRQVMTEAEKRMWYRLRAHRLLGFKFKRQKPIGPYVVDFACPALRLVIEIDGGQHSIDADEDSIRDRWLRKHGYTVLRFWNNEVMENLEGVLEAIASVALSDAPSPLAPLPISGEGSFRLRRKGSGR